MKSQTRAFHQKTLLRALYSVVLFILVILSPLCLKAQIDCKQSLSPLFPLGGGPQTLCERYAIPGPFPYQFGTSHTVYASQIMWNINNGSNVFTGDIDLVGDLIIDEDFTLLNCKIRISPDVKIRVWADVTLTLDGSKLFCCQMMWQGIDLDNRSSIVTKNISEIEDSEIAIESRCSATLSIRNTIFNRNEVGIRFGYDGPSVPHPCPTLPVFTQFSGNTFQCNLPLNGTTDEVGFAGIQVYKTNATIGSLTSSINTFRNIRYGIRYESQYWWGTSSVNRCRFEDILDDGIHLKRGNLTVDRCIFTNCGFRGINVISTSGLIVQRSNFNYTDNIPNSLVSHAVYRHIEATGFGVNCEVNINHNTFRGNFTDPINLENIRGIELRGGITMGSGTNILIDRNNFIFIYEQDGFSDISYEILLNGEFPTTTSTTVQFNNFFLDQPTGQVPLNGLTLANGNKNNVKIYSNYFDSGSRGPFSVADVDAAIRLNGSMGSGNEISGNIITPNLNTLFSNNFATGLHSLDFLNATFCENNLRESGLPMVFQGASMGTQCIGNTVTGGGTSFLVQEGYIGEQGIEGGAHFGNKWYDKWPNVTPTNHARHMPIELAPNSRIWVNTPQSILNPQGPGYTFFSQFHPAKIDPDQNDEWVKEDPLGTVTASECVNFAVISTGTDKAIASGSINTLIQNPTLIWTGKRYLYAKLTQNPDLQDDYQEFASFLAFQAQTSVGQLFAVEQKIKEALQIPMTLETKLDIVKTNINQLNQLVVAVDSILDVSSNALELTDAKQQKQNYAEQLYQLDSLYDKLHGEYVTGMHLILQEVLTLNGLVTATTGYEQNEKTVNDITLNAILFQDGILTSEQINTLVSIAEECPKTGGHGVYRARGVLSDCQIEIWNDNSATCLPMPEPGEEQILNNNLAAQPNEYSTDKLLIFPNPAVDGFSVRVPPNNSGVLTLVDGLGKIQRLTRFSEEEGFYYVELDNLPQGIYFCTIHLSNGEVQITKVFVAGN